MAQEAASPPNNGDGKRQRATGTRSRSGCMTCRARHVRCDETRPDCKNCVIGKRMCEYKTSIPLRDRRIFAQGKIVQLPGQDGPWSAHDEAAAMVALAEIPIWKTQPGETFDPFDVLPIKMPFKSKELFRYFHRATESFDVVADKKEEDCVALAALDEHALRNTMIIAGLHYSWNTGNFKAYERTILFHKVSCMGKVAQWLRQPDAKTATLCVREIVTLCMAEASLGNLEAAETHIVGLGSFLRIQEEQNPDLYDSDNVDIEMANRYMVNFLLFLFVFIPTLSKRSSSGSNTKDSTAASLNTRFREFTEFLQRERSPSDAADSESAAMAALRAFHVPGPASQSRNLRAARLFPSFFAPPPSSRAPRPVDSLAIITSLRSTTAAVDAVVEAENHPDRGDRHVSREDLWNGGSSASDLSLACVECHARSFSKAEATTTAATSGMFRFPSMWCGVAAPAAMYLRLVMGVTWAGGSAVERRLLRRTMLILKRDITRTRGILLPAASSYKHAELARNFWFWKVFVSAVVLEKVQQEPAGQSRHNSNVFGSNSKSAVPVDEGEEDAIRNEFEELKGWYEDRLREWSRVSGVRKWLGAKDALMSVVWPKESPEELETACPKALWERVVATW